MNRRADDVRVTARRDAAGGRAFDAGGERRALELAVRRARREAVELALAQANGNVADAAVLLGILRTSLYRTMKRLGVAHPTKSGS